MEKDVLRGVFLIRKAVVKLLYSTIQGDTWDLISFKNYGREKFIQELMEANYKYRRTSIFGSGIALNIPDIPPEVITSTLPPWEV